MTDTKTSSLPLALEDYRRLRDEYDTADKVMKEVRAFVDEAGIPAINELRYAGYHLLNTIFPANGERGCRMRSSRGLSTTASGQLMKPAKWGC